LDMDPVIGAVIFGMRSAGIKFNDKFMENLRISNNSLLSL